MNRQANSQNPSQPHHTQVQRKEKIMKTTLRTLLAVTTLFTLLTTAIANSNQGPCSDLCFTIASAYYDGDTHAASQQLISLRPSSDTLETLVRNVASNYYDGNEEAAAAEPPWV